MDETEAEWLAKLEREEEERQWVESNEAGDYGRHDEEAQ